MGKYVVEVDTEISGMFFSDFKIHFFHVFEIFVYRYVLCPSRTKKKTYFVEENIIVSADHRLRIKVADKISFKSMYDHNNCLNES